MSYKKNLILASSSQVRRHMLEECGIAFTVYPSPYDEEAQKETIRTLSPKEQAVFLADGKAQAVSLLFPDAYVIGADQVCANQENIFGKPLTYTRAVSHLQALQGGMHYQHSAACVYYHGQCVWQVVETVTLTMKMLSQEEIEDYVRLDNPLSACGAYCYEKQGHTLFSHVDGSADAIKGLPLQGLLSYLANEGVIDVAIFARIKN